MIRIAIVFIFPLLLFSCGSKTNKWSFEVKNDCRFTDAFHVKTSFTPVRYRLSVKGNLSDSARLVQNVYSDGSNEMSSHTIKLDSGKVDLSLGNDFYSNNLTIIYIPSQETKTTGKLTIAVEVD